MKIFVAPNTGEMGKFHSVVQAFPEVWNGSLLDIGCRSQNFKQALPVQCINYFGLDIFPPADALSNLEVGLPFQDNSFDTAVALDILEHTNDIHRAFSELCRVTSQYIVISLPNIYEIKMRFKFLLGKPTSGKYGLPIQSVMDRHRWFFSFDDARQFCAAVSKQHGFELMAEGGLIGPKRAKMSKIVAHFPTLFAPTYLVLLGKH